MYMYMHTSNSDTTTVVVDSSEILQASLCASEWDDVPPSRA